MKKKIYKKYRKGKRGGQRYWVGKNTKSYSSFFVTPSKKHITQLEKITSERHGPIGTALDYPLSQSLEKAKGYPELSDTLYEKEYADKIKASDKRGLRLINEGGVIKGAIITLRNPKTRQKMIHSIIIPKQYRNTGVASRAVKNLLKDQEIDMVWGQAQQGTHSFWRKLGAEETKPGSGIYKYDKTKKRLERNET